MHHTSTLKIASNIFSFGFAIAAAGVLLAISQMPESTTQSEVYQHQSEVDNTALTKDDIRAYVADYFTPNTVEIITIHPLGNDVYPVDILLDNAARTVYVQIDGTIFELTTK